MCITVPHVCKTFVVVEWFMYTDVGWFIYTDVCSSDTGVGMYIPWS